MMMTVMSMSLVLRYNVSLFLNKINHDDDDDDDDNADECKPLPLLTIQFTSSPILVFAIAVFSTIIQQNAKITAYLLNA